jgi:hypothetical protein
MPGRFLAGSYGQGSGLISLLPGSPIKQRRAPPAGRDDRVRQTFSDFVPVGCLLIRLRIRAAFHFDLKADSFPLRTTIPLTSFASRPTKPNEPGNSENICPSPADAPNHPRMEGISSISSGKAKHGLIEVADIRCEKADHP